MPAGTEDQPAAAATRYEFITVTLAQSEPSEVNALPVRNIRFTAAQPKVQIGRSSKTVSKGLMPDVGNAYFDSPVMSREHAEMTADLDEGLVFLKDKGSLHGTSVNNAPLPMESLQRLNNGDRICFGIHIARGLEVFNPAMVQVTVTPHETMGEPRARAYSAPEPTDEMSDAGSDYDCSNSRLSSVEADDIVSVHSTNSGRAGSESDKDSARADSLPSELPSTVAGMAAEEYGEDEGFTGMDGMDGMDHADENRSYRFPSIGVDDSDDGMASSSSDASSDADSHVGTQAPFGFDHEEGEIHGKDDGSAFLSAEIAHFVEQSRPVAAMESVAVEGLWTPPSAAAAHSADEAEPSGKDDVAKDQTDEGALPQPNKKYNISSILNPSPPPSSPAKEEMMTLHELLGPYSKGSNESLLSAALHMPLFDEDELMAMSRISTATPVKSLTPPETSPVLGLEGHAGFPRARILVGGTDAAMESAAEYSATIAPEVNIWREGTPGVQNKRKADVMQQDASEADAAEARLPAAMPVEAVAAAAPAKRQATETAVGGNRKLKTVAWAITEKVGIAALGGAVVLGSLIYTAPSF